MPKPFSAIPGPKGFPLIGSLLDYSRFGRYNFERMHVAKRENLAAYGKIYKEKMGTTMVNLFDPVDVETVFRAEDKYPVRPPLSLMETASKREGQWFGISVLNGEPWWRHRSAVQKSMMSPGAAHVYLPAQNQVADDFVNLLSWKLDKESGKLDEDIPKLLQKYTMEAFGAVCFNVRIGCLEPTIAPDSDAHEVIRSVDKAFEALQKTLYAFPWYAIFRTPLYRQYFESWSSLQRIACPYVEEGLKSDEVEVDGRKVKGKSFLRTMVDNHSDKLTNEELIRLTLDLFNGGIDTTAYALSFCLYNLAKNVDKQNRLLSEIDSILDRTSCEPVTPEVLNRMQYLKACVKESFRMNFPISDGVLRIITSDLVLSDYLVPKGTTVWMNFQTMCLMEEYFEHADRYLPERWLKGEGDSLRPASSFFLLPFSHGPRMCIGRRFAEQEMWLGLIKIFQRFRLQLDADASDHRPIGMMSRIFTMPDAKLPLKFIPR